MLDVIQPVCRGAGDLNAGSFVPELASLEFGQENDSYYLPIFIFAHLLGVAQVALLFKSISCLPNA